MPKRGSTNLVRAYSRVTTAFASRKKILPQAKDFSVKILELVLWGGVQFPTGSDCRGA